MNSATLPPLAALLHLSDSALPTGAFTHSFGLESFMHDGRVADEQHLIAWLRDYLHVQLVPTDAAVLHRAHHASNADEITALDRQLSAVLAPQQVRQASTGMGKRLLEIAAESFASPSANAYADAVRAGTCDGHFVLVFALIGRDLGFDSATLTEAYLHSALAALVTNAVRAIPLGQLAGQRVLTALRAELPRAVARSERIDDMEFGAAAPSLEINQMRHEHLHARLFAS